VGFFDPDRLSLSMSGFDEEAERERLREKYEQDQEKRATTQRMSELLLKGATMTNSHCDTCGDPIFRYDGQEFCPTCQAAEQAAVEGDAAAAADAEAGGPAGDSEPEPEPEPEPDATATDPDAQSATEAAAPDRRALKSASDDTAATVSDARGRELAANAGATRTQSRGPSRPADTSIDEARASLSRTLVRYAQAAEETDDPRRAREFLAAAREAAETLSALEY
jgi:uncharacterized Zn finger protein (UPF0148 family)